MPLFYKEVSKITREPFLKKIGGEDIGVPSPESREEYFINDVIEQTQTLTPETRKEKLMAKLSGADIATPTPETRIEKILAYHADAVDNLPTPETKEEYYWSLYSAIVEKELEGIPPLTFKSNGANLSNYLIYGNTVNGESVGDLVESGEHTGKYRVPVTINSNTTSIYLPHQIRKVGDEAEYIDYGEQKQRRVRKNLLLNTATSQTKNGVTFTVNSDGSVTCNGTASDAAWFALNKSFDIYAPDGRIASIGNNGSTSTFYMNISYVGNITSSRKFSGTIHQNVYVQLVIAAGYTCNNLTFYPMIRKADITDNTYEPYIENAELDVTLPALPTLSGTNTLSVETTVQPSKVYVKYKGAR